MDDSDNNEEREESPTQPQVDNTEIEDPAQFDLASLRTASPPDVADATAQVEFLKERVVFAEGTSPSSWPDRTLNLMDTFISDPSKRSLCLYKEGATGHFVEATFHAPPPELRRKGSTSFDQDLWYFVKKEEQQPSAAGQKLTHDDVLDMVQFGTVDQDCLLSLQRRAFSIYFADDHIEKAPSYFQQSNSDFADNLAEFLGSLNKACSLLKQQTNFYVAGMAHRMNCLDNFEAEESRKAILHFEALALHWVEQAEELLTIDTLKSSSINYETPMEEIEIWRKYLKIITSLKEQLTTNLQIHQVREILKYWKSPFKPLFDKLLAEIADCMQLAQSEIDILSTVTELSRKIAKDDMDVAPLHVANFIDEVVRASKKEALKMDAAKISKLLDRVCNAVVSRCTAEISVQKIRQGFMKTIAIILSDNLNLCKLLKTLYRQAAVQNEWNLKESDLFQTIDSFVQRCIQLNRICTTIGQFSRWGDGQKKPLETMFGENGPYFYDLLQDIEIKFDQILEEITENPDVLTDLKATEWTPMLDKFKRDFHELKKDLSRSKVIQINWMEPHERTKTFDQNVDFVETLLENATIRAFETITTVQEGVEILSNLEELADRETILELFVNHTTHIHKMFLQDIYTVKLKLCEISTKYHNNCWDLANLGCEANSIFRNVQKSMAVIEQCQWIPITKHSEKVRNDFDEISSIIENFTAKVYSDWCSTVTRKIRDSSKMLNVPVFSLRSPKHETFECNLDNEIISLCKDVHTWKNIGMDPTSVIGNLSDKSNVILELHSQVTMAANDYNNLSDALTQEEKQFFSIKITELREIYSPGLLTITWLTPNITTTFFQDCKSAIVKLQEEVQLFKKKLKHIEDELLLILEINVIQDKFIEVIDVANYSQVQNEVKEELFERTTKHHASIVKVMQEIEDMFTEEELQQVWKHWWKFIDNIDKKFENSVRTCVTNNIILMNNNLDVINRQKNFRLLLDINLHDDTLLKMLMPFKTISSNLIGSLDRISRLTDVITESESSRKPIHLILDDDENLIKIQAEITEKVDETLRQFHQEMSNWKPYREMLEADQEIFFDSYKKMNPTLESITKDACSYAQIIKIIKVMNPIIRIGFIEVNSNELQQEMLKLALIWKEKLHELSLFEITASLENQCKFVNYTIKRVRNDTRCLVEDEPQINNAIVEFQHMLVIINTLERNGFLLNRVIRSHLMEVTEQLDVLQKIPKEDVLSK